LPSKEKLSGGKILRLIKIYLGKREAYSVLTKMIIEKDYLPFLLRRWSQDHGRGKAASLWGA